MKYLYVLILILIYLVRSITVFSQSDTLPYKYRVQFKDKKNSLYSVNNPSQYLSPKSILRRLIHNVKIDETDLPVIQSYVDSISKTGVQILIKSKWLNSVDISRVDSTSLKKIKSFPFVSNVQSVYINLEKSLKTEAIPFKQPDFAVKDLYAYNDNNNFKRKFYITGKTDLEPYSIYYYGESYEQIRMIACDSLHKRGYTGKGITIALLDAGFIGTSQISCFDSLRNNSKILGTKDFVIPGGSVYTLSDHGTMVLSTIAGNIPGSFVGTAPDADFWLLRTEDVRTENMIEVDNWVSGAEFADSVGADIISSSLGYTEFDDSTNNFTYKNLNGKTARASIAATMAAKKGIIVLNSAGNEGNTSWKYVVVPGDADSILTVGAVDVNGIYAFFSSEGPTSDGRIKPDVAALGYGASIIDGSNNIISGNGTSFSTPIIAGMVACLLQTNPGLNDINIINAVIKSCNHYYNPNYFVGYGIPNANSALRILSSPQIVSLNKPDPILVYPSPFYNRLNIVIISANLNNNTIIELFDLAGRKMFSEEYFMNTSGNYYNTFIINNLENLANGIYILKISSGGKVTVKKVIKQSN